MEVYHEFGSDLELTPQGDLKTADGAELTNQRIVRRLLTNAPDYIWIPGYGAGIPKYIGQLNDPTIFKTIKGAITSQMYLEDAVSQSPPPDIQFQVEPNFLECTITYMHKFVNKQVVVSFTVPT